MDPKQNKNLMKKKNLSKTRHSAESCLETPKNKRLIPAANEKKKTDTILFLFLAQKPESL